MEEVVDKGRIVFIKPVGKRGEGYITSVEQGRELAETKEVLTAGREGKKSG